jgi:hypothetical protein
MTTVRHLGSANPATPFATIERRSIAVNTANRQIAVGDENAATVGTPLNLIAVRYFDARGVYAINDLVVNGGGLYRAISATGPGAFNTAHWVDVTGTVVVADSQPAAAQGSLWWESDTGILWLYYHDGNSGQWVQAGGASTSDPAKADTTTVVRHDIAQSLNATQQERARLNIAAAPLDALAYSGLQINGSMEVSQEHGTTVVTLPSGSSKYITDNWMAGFGHPTAVLTSQQFEAGNMPLSNDAYFAKFMNLNATVAMGSIAAGDYAYLFQLIEGYRIARLGWGTSVAKPITIGFWVFATITGTAAISIINTADSRSYIAEFTTVGGAWVYRTVTIPGNAAGTWGRINLGGFGIFFSFGSGSNFHGAPNTWINAIKFATAACSNFFSTAGNAVGITGVTILPGTQAPTAAQSPLIMRPYGQELVTCKRYYEVFRYSTSEYICQMQAVSAGQATGTIVHYVEKRAAPTVAMGPNVASFNLQQAGGGGSPLNNASVTASTTKWSGSLFVASGLIAGNSTTLYSATNASIAIDARL